MLSLDEILWHEKHLKLEGLGDDIKSKFAFRLEERNELSRLLAVLLKYRTIYYHQMILRVYAHMEMLSHLYKPRVLFNWDIKKFGERVGIGSSQRRHDMLRRESAKGSAKRRLSQVSQFTGQS